MCNQPAVPAQLDPSPSHTPHWSYILPELGTPSHPEQLDPSPSHTPHWSLILPELGTSSQPRSIENLRVSVYECVHYGMQMHACSHVCISIGSQHDPTVGRDGVGADWRKHTQPPRTYRCHRLFRKEYVYRVRVYARVIHRNTYTCIRLQAHG